MLSTRRTALRAGRAAGLGLLVAAALLPAAAPVFAAPAAAPALAAPAAPKPVAKPTAEQAALAEARAQKKPVEVKSLSTKGRVVKAQPNGTFTAELSTASSWNSPARMGWAKVFSGHANWSFWNGGSDGPDAKVGQCGFGAGCNGIGVARSYFQYDTAFLAGKQILAASLNSVVTHSPSCQLRNHQLFAASGAISPGTTWENQPHGSHLSTLTVPGAYAGGCAGAKFVGFNAAQGVRPGGVSTFYVKAENEGDSFAWRKYDAYATNLVVQYNSTPNAPYELATDPGLAAPCTLCAGKSYVGDSSIRLRARLSDPDGGMLRATFHAYVGSSRIERTTGYQESGSVFTTDIDLTPFHGQSIEWYVTAQDEVVSGPWSHGPGFVVDRVAPDAAPTVAGTSEFTFGSAGVADVAYFLYGWDDTTTFRVDADALGGTATVTLAPPGTGPRTLYVRSVDRAGHRSPVAAHPIFTTGGA